MNSSGVSNTDGPNLVAVPDVVPGPASDVPADQDLVDQNPADQGPTVSGYGTWRSPITTDMLTSATLGLGSVFVDQGVIHWTQSRADEGGRVSLWRQEATGEAVDLTPGHNLRATVHEYGGGAVDIRDGVVVFTDFPGNVLHVQRLGEEAVAITSEGPMRYAALRVYPEHDLILAVREDHSGSGYPENTIVSLSLSGEDERVLVSGADFYDTPSLGPDSQIAWCEWNHPDMPWDTTCLRVGRITDGAVVDVVDIAWTEEVSAIRPEWFPGGGLAYLSDESGFWNINVWDGQQSTPWHFHPADFDGPPWQLGRGTFAILDDHRILCTWLDRGVARLGLLVDGSLLPWRTPVNTVLAVACDEDAVAAIVGFPDRPRAVVQIDLATGELTELRRTTVISLPPGLVSAARPLTSGVPVSYAWYYPPTNPDFRAPEGELPPLRVLSHGGPTAFSAPALRLEIQYWTSRGFAVVDVNYGGSSGYGREYRDRLQGMWGIVDVADCLAAVSHLVDDGLADPDRVWIEGGSAGGYTTLQALTTTNAFSAGISHYGVADLAALAKDTHKFESRYLDGLIGPYPEAAETYRERSPLYYLDDLSTPMLILQGTEDRVVPPNQAETMAAAVRAKGLPVALLMFEGEAHGFRQAESIRRSLEASQAFLGQVFGFTPADDLPELAIDNLPGAHAKE